MWKQINKDIHKILDWLERLFTDPRWEVLIMTYSGGQGEKFYHKDDALKYAETYKGSSDWVSLIDRKLKDGFEKRTIINDPQAKEKDRNCKHKWETRSRASWWCSKCNAEFNLSCEHCGSIACSACVDKLIKENKPFEIYLAEHSW